MKSHFTKLNYEASMIRFCRAIAVEKLVVDKTLVYMIEFHDTPFKSWKALLV